MFVRKNRVIVIVLLLLLVASLSACDSLPTKEEAIEAVWGTSAHANKEATAFSRWNDSDPPEVPANCAKCHSTPGYLDYLGADGSTPGQVDSPAPTGTSVECEACHNDVSLSRNSAMMPSGIELPGLDHNADCMSCHQGRASTTHVNTAIADMPLDEVNTEISAPGAHNAASGPTAYGTAAKGGYEYEGQTYVGRYNHTSDRSTCIECHNPHNLGVNTNACSACHLGALTEEDLPNIRLTDIDYDGDGDTSEGMSGEITTMQENLMLAIRFYVFQTEGAEPLVIERRFTNEAGDSYTTWTPRLLKAAYNYQYSMVAPGGYVHNPRYAIQLLYDSMDDLGFPVGGMERPE